MNPGFFITALPECTLSSNPSSAFSGFATESKLLQKKRGVMVKKAGAVLVFLLVVLPLTAQVDRSSINGTITDPKGAALPNARVEATASGTGLRRQATTGQSGTYQLTGLPIG